MNSMISLPDPRTLFTGLMASAVMCHHIRRATARTLVQRRTLEKYVYLQYFWLSNVQKYNKLDFM